MTRSMLRLLRPRSSDRRLTSTPAAMAMVAISTPKFHGIFPGLSDRSSAPTMSDIAGRSSTRLRWRSRRVRKRPTARNPTTMLARRRGVPYSPTMSWVYR